VIQKYENTAESCALAKIYNAIANKRDIVRTFASWEGGSNKKRNGLLRQYIPKKRAMPTVSDEKIRMIQNRLNNRLRKRLGCKTLAEVFLQSLKRVALRT